MYRRKEEMIVRAGQCALVFLAVVMAGMCGEALSGPLRFPLTNDICPTSSFGSYRPGHLHAGLDFSTGGVTGVPVLAVDSCLVWRIRLWNGGYGRALYAELADGKTAVYGHLSRFIPEIERLVEAEQDRRGRYAVELLLGSEALRFGPGDTLAFSGETGSGPPHLHFELRSGRGDHDKINPIPDYMDLAETARPVIESIRFTPLVAQSRVNGSYRPVTVTPGPEMGTLTVAGAFGVSVFATDPVQCGRVLKPIHYWASIDQVPVFLLSLDRFPFSKGHFVGGFYEPAGGSRFVRLYDAYDLDFRGFTCRTPTDLEAGGLLTPGEHELVVSVSDAWGNTREAALPFVYGTLPAFRRFRLRRDSTKVAIEIEAEPAGRVAEVLYRTGRAWHPLETGRPDDGLTTRTIGLESRVEVRCRIEDSSGLAREGFLATGGQAAGADTAVDLRTALHPGFVEIYAAPTSSPSSLPEATIYEGDMSRSVLLQPVGERLFRGTFVPGPESGTVRIEVRVEFDGQVVARTTGLELGLLKPGREVWFSTENYRVKLAAPTGYCSQSLVTVSEEPGKVHRGFLSSAGRLVLEPADVFFNERIDVLVVRKDRSLKTGHGVFAEAGEWASFRGRFNERGWCEFKMRRPEHLVILEERDGPEIGPIQNFRRRPADGKATFASRITDGGSGVDDGSLRAYVDDEVAIVSIDPDTGVVGGRTTKPLPYGEHRIRLVAEDRLGNATDKEFTVSLSR